MQLAYIMALIGIPATKTPVAAAKAVLINYIKVNWSHTNINEMREAFDNAVEHQFIDLNLYDRIFNIEYIKSVIMAYRQFKNKEIKPQTTENEGMTNHKRAEGIIGIIAKQNPELYEKLKNIGKEKSKPTPQKNEATQRIKTVFNDYELEYKKLWDEQSPINHGGPFIAYKQKMLNFSEYCNYRFEEDHPQIEEEEPEEQEEAQ